MYERRSTNAKKDSEKHRKPTSAPAHEEHWLTLDKTHLLHKPLNKASPFLPCTVASAQLCSVKAQHSLLDLKWRDQTLMTE